MDIFSHGLWAGAAYKGVNLKRDKPLNVRWAVFWGVFPDLFAFTIPFVWLFGNILFGNINFSDIRVQSQPEPEAKQIFGNGDTRLVQSPIAHLASALYNISHSLVIFLLIFGLAILILRFLKKQNGVPWEMGGWLIHILLDVPTHSYGLFPTPIFWPIAGWKFNGYSWAHPWFIVADYSAIIIAYLLLRIFSKRRHRKIPRL